MNRLKPSTAGFLPVSFLGAEYFTVRVRHPRRYCVPEPDAILLGGSRGLPRPQHISHPAGGFRLEPANHNLDWS